MRTEQNDMDNAAQMNAQVESLARSWHVLRQTGMTWDLKNAQTHLAKLRPLLQNLATVWQKADDEITALTEQIKQRLNTPEYAAELEQELQAAGIPFSGDFPLYVLPPFKLAVSLDNYEARLSLGRKNERTADLNPQKLAKWVAIRYKKIISRKFNATAFMKDLLEAYRLAERLNYQEKEMVWGRAVPIMELYEILTIKATARQDYPRQFFIFDLGLLKESASLMLDKYHFELGFARNQARAIVVVDSRGRESRISSLTIYQDEGGQ